MENKMTVEVNGNRFTVTLENNEAVEALTEMMREKPVTIQMREYSGFEKVGVLGTSLPTNDRQTTTQSGDIVLYQGNQIVIFYGSNSWSYTRLGKIEDLTGWNDALGSGDVTVTFSLQIEKESEVDKRYQYDEGSSRSKIVLNKQGCQCA